MALGVNVSRWEWKWGTCPPGLGGGGEHRPRMANLFRTVSLFGFGEGLKFASLCSQTKSLLVSAQKRARGHWLFPALFRPFSPLWFPPAIEGIDRRAAVELHSVFFNQTPVGEFINRIVVPGHVEGRFVSASWSENIRTCIPPLTTRGNIPGPGMYGQ